MATLKNVSVAFLAMGLSGTALAAEYPLPPDIPSDTPVFYEPETTKQGLYVGLGVGALDLNNKMTATSTVTNHGSTVYESSGSTSENNVGVNGTLDLGYSWTLPSRFFFGVEGFGNLTSAKTSQSLNKTQTIGNYTATASGTADFKWENVYGARVLPGFQVTQHSVLYGIVGYARANADLSNATNNSSITDNATSTSENVSANSSIYNNYGFNGYQVGLGTMIDLVPHLALRADFIYSGYSSQTLATRTTPFESGSATTSLSADPYTLEGDLSLVYMFG